MEKFLKDFVQSSADPEKVSMTVKGILLTYVGLIAVLLHLFGIDFSEAQIVELISQVAVAVGSALTIVGAVRKLILSFKK